MILVDTSVWVDHFRKGVAHLAHLLEQGAVVMHPFIVGELACGSLANRWSTLELLRDLPMAVIAEFGEVLGYIEHHELHGRGLGYVDVHLLTSVALTGGTTLWTHDKRLLAAAADLGWAHSGHGSH